MDHKKKMDKKITFSIGGDMNYQDEKEFKEWWRKTIYNKAIDIREQVFLDMVEEYAMAAWFAALEKEREKE
jgi:hypothetical protein